MRIKRGIAGALLPIVLIATGAPALSVEIDGRIGIEEWAAAQSITDFRKTQPLNGEPGSFATEAWILATPEGLAVAFRNTQPPSVARNQQRVQRDFQEQVDRINLMVDYDGDGRTAYNFTVSSTDGIYDGVITNENFFNRDWDGNWRHAVSGDAEIWSVEVLIPWHIAPMREANGGKRTVKIYLDRVVGATGERVAWPQASFERPRFVSDFAAVELANYSQSLLAVTPYVSALYDRVRDSSKGDAGVDLFWKPNGQTQLTATLNPDFGQVESDDLVVNFGATETFVSDKRPFFTENQSIFEFTTPSDFSQLLYTRRIGGPADDGQGAGDIVGALKLNGSLGATKYGLFAADEAEAAGRTFGALRLTRDFSKQNVGLMATQVKRPFLDRTATVLGVDHNWRPNASWNIRTRVFGSDIDQAGESVRDTGASLWADYEMDHGWRQQFMAMHFGNDLQINDAGYLARNSTNYVHWELKRRFTELPAESRYSSKDWRLRLGSDYNDHGLLMNHQVRVSRQGRMRNGSFEYAQINVNSAGYDDLLTRGNGVARMPASFNAYFEYDRPRKGNWAYYVEFNPSTGGFAGNNRLGYYVNVEPKYFLSDAFNLYLGASYSRTPDWLIWQRENLVGGFAGRESHLNAGFDWTIGQRQELRFKLQAIAIDARLETAYRIASNGDPIESAEPVDDFSVRNLGFQIRYRYELGPLSYLYVVYGRGGFDRETETEGLGRQLRQSFSLRDDEQLLVKLSYRFE
jgi:hypothetical protein